MEVVPTKFAGLCAAYFVNALKMPSVPSSTIKVYAKSLVIGCDQGCIFIIKMHCFTPSHA